VKTKFYNLSIINAYASTEDKDELIKDQFYYKLEQACETMPSSDVQIIVGDLNAQVGKEETFQGTIGLHSLHNTSNDNDQRLIDLRQARTWSSAQHLSPVRKYTNIHGSP
jgi:hypothetical protein